LASLQRSGSGERPAPGLPDPAVLRSQVFSTSQRFAPPSTVTALFHAAGALGIHPFRVFPLLKSVAPLDARSPLDVTVLCRLGDPRQAASHSAFPARPPSGGCPSSKSVLTMAGVNRVHRSRYSPGLPPLQGSPRPRDGYALTSPPLTYLDSVSSARKHLPFRPVPQSIAPRGLWLVFESEPSKTAVLPGVYSLVTPDAS
jgi:hypothetical protein